MVRVLSVLLQFMDLDLSFDLQIMITPYGIFNLLTIALSVLQSAESAYPFGIFKLFASALSVLF